MVREVERHAALVSAEQQSARPGTGNLSLTRAEPGVGSVFRMFQIERLSVSRDIGFIGTQVLNYSRRLWLVLRLLGFGLSLALPCAADTVETTDDADFVAQQAEARKS